MDIDIGKIYNHINKSSEKYLIGKTSKRLPESNHSINQNFVKNIAIIVKPWKLIV